MSQVKRILISKDPFLANKSTLWQEKGFWPASWISHPNKLAKPFVTAYKLDFKLVKDSEFNIHVTADERYELFLDGKRIGRGSERGDADNWFFETYQLNLKKGKHLIVAKVWSLGDKAPMAQMSVEAGFLLAAEAEFEELISTGFANWQVMELKGFDFQIPPATFWRGARLSLDAKQYAWGFENGKGNWQTAKVGKRASNKVIAYVWYKVHRLVAATLPAMLAKKIGDISAKYIDDAKISNSKEVKIDFQNNATDKLDSWQNLLDGKQKITIAANSSQRIILDMNDYYCLFYELSVSKGKNAKVQIHSAESLYTDTKFVEKGHRDQLENKYFNGVGDDFVCDGGNLRRLEPIQFQAGRYWQIQ
ncbi:MAG TPA: alpha-L-rhamnosidase, partial [Trueperaceae bacterium]|nr:alpha-L-rhamnosidase [Trueperaceae bacterium]